VTTGGSFGASPFRQHIGLGKATIVESLTIRWPASGTTQTFRNVPVNQAIEIRESVTTYTVVERKPFRLGT
jgi:hypothetical protein